MEDAMGEEDEAGDAPESVERVPEVTSKPGGMFRDLLEGSFPELYEEPKPEPEGGEGEEGEDGGDGDGAPAEPPAGDPPAEGEEDAEPEVDEYQQRIDAIRTQVRARPRATRTPLRRPRPRRGAGQTFLPFPDRSPRTD